MRTGIDPHEYIRQRGLDGLTLERQDLMTLAIDMRIPIKQLAELLHCHEELILRKAKRWQLPVASQEEMGDKNQRPPRPPDERFSARQRLRYGSAIMVAKEYIADHGLASRDPTIEELHYLYVTLKLPKTYLNQLFGQRLGFLLQQAGIPRRGTSEQRLLGYNSAIFQTWTPESAWVLGLIYTDGTLSGNRVSLSSIDLDLLEKVRDLLAPHVQIQTHGQSYDKSRTISRLEILHPQIVSDLRALGLQERKSLIMTFPDVPDSLMRHFVRGCWDGDGGFTWGGGKLCAHYTCGSKAFIDRLSVELFRVGIGRRQLAQVSSAEREALQRTYGDGPYPLRVHKRKSANAYDLRFGTQENLRCFCGYLYDDVSPALCLARKRALLYDYVLGLHSKDAD